MDGIRFTFRQVALLSLLVLVLVTPVAFADVEPVAFVDDFSEGLSNWQIVWDPAETIKVADGHLLFGYQEQEDTRMRVKDLVTNDFDLKFVADLELETWRNGWMGVRFGATIGPAFRYGHIIYIFPNGLIQLLFTTHPGEPKNDDNLVTLGKVPAFTGTSTVEVRVRPNAVQVIVDSEHIFLHEVEVEPGHIEFFARWVGPVHIYQVELEAYPAE